MSACGAFRERLAGALAGRASEAGSGALAWHAHLFECGACSALLQAEEALELVLASLPEPELPARLAERVLARLARERGATLDGLLELDRVAAPAQLPERLLAGLAAGRAGEAAERRLDRLLERVPVPAAPGHLAERVLAGLAPARGLRPLARVRSLRLAAAAAAALALAWAGWHVFSPAAVGPAPSSGAESLAAAAQGEPDPELLRALDVLERWDVLADEDVAPLLAALDPVEEELLDIAYAEEDG